MRLTPKSLLILGALPVLVLRAHAQEAATPSSVTRHVAEGVDLVQETTPDGAPGGPLVVTILKVNPQVSGVRVEAGLGQDRVWGTDPTFGRERVSPLVARHSAVAGINAGFFPFKGNPLGLHIQNGDLVTEPILKPLSPSFWVNKNGSTGFGTFAFAGSVRWGDAPPLTVNSMNREPGKPDADELLLYTPIFFPHTLASPERTEVILSGIESPLRPNQNYVGKVASLTAGGNTPIAKGTLVLSGSGKMGQALKALSPGTKVTIRLDVTAAEAGDITPDFSQVQFAVTGRQRLMARGEIVPVLRQEGTGGSFITTRHPRTSLGRTADGTLLLVTVDGRQKGFSRGASLHELAEIFRRLGATDALNLDGGGSSSVVVYDAIADSPSEGVERPVADMLLVYANNRIPTRRYFVAPNLMPPDHTLTVGETFQLHGTLPKDDPDAVWGTQGGVGFVSQEGMFRAIRPGKGTVLVSRGGRGGQIRVPITIVGASTADASGFTATVSLQPDGDQKGTLRIHIANAEGDPLGNEPVAVTITGGTPETTTVTTDAKGNARVGVQWETAHGRVIQLTSPRKRFRDVVLTEPFGSSPGGPALRPAPGS